MAPFNTHFLIAEKLWPELDGPWQPHYGLFCFGNLAPDVDKASATLTQRQTHFYDRSGDYEYMVSHRSATFIAQQAEFLGQPFPALPPEAQAFALGYLCHLSIDEVSKHMWRQETWRHFWGRGLSPIAAFSALDEVARQQTADYPAIVEALCMVQVPKVLPAIEPHDLTRFLYGCCAFVQAADAEAEYLALIDLFDQPSPTERREKLASFQSQLAQARSLVPHFHLDKLVTVARRWSLSRMRDFIAGRVPDPAYPPLE